ncbi:MAG: hypothetical protein ACK42H_00480 [Planctomycetota bacterium]|jgi:hypothetical protein
MPIEGPRLTEERLRNHLDSNQVMRERLCLALMPLIGPYTRECPRRPKGGPDGGRDIEAIHEGSTVAWGAVGFRNGGGNDEQARRETSAKFESDLRRSIEENPTLQAFVFFTNVDLTPTIVEKLRDTAVSKGVTVVDIVDLERLRHALDSPEGLIARLQYLDIPMSATEQIALVNKFGTQLQSAIATRFDRVERTLSQMEQFLGYQKPLYRLDAFVAIEGDHRSSDIGNEGILLKIGGLQDLGKMANCLLWNLPSHPNSSTQLVTFAQFWLDEDTNKILPFMPSLGLTRSIMTAYCELSLTTGGHRVRLADLTSVTMTAYVTAGLYPFLRRIVLDANGYELFNCPAATAAEESPVELPVGVKFKTEGLRWYKVVNDVPREFIFAPPLPSGRLSPLRRFKQ